VLAKGTPRFAGDVHIGQIGITTDITELKQSQEQLQAAQKLESLGVLAGGIAHDFNNLLGGIHAEAELVETDLAVGSAAREEVQRIKMAAIRGSEIVRELMIYAGENQKDFNESVDVSLLVEEMLELLKVSISKQVALRTDFRGELPTVWGNAPQIRQLMMNLVLNASEAIGDAQGVITVTAAQVSGGSDLAPNNTTDLTPGDYVRIEVSDTGGGMTNETKAKIFDPFFSTKFPGRGLGLAVVRGIVRDLGGAINVVSAPGQGAVFQVLLPSAPKSALEIHLRSHPTGWRSPMLTLGPFLSWRTTRHCGELSQRDSRSEVFR
jgi:signal transduction histidine kinase